MYFSNWFSTIFRTFQNNGHKRYTDKNQEDDYRTFEGNTCTVYFHWCHILPRSIVPPSRHCLLPRSRTASRNRDRRAILAIYEWQNATPETLPASKYSDARGQIAWQIGNPTWIKKLEARKSIGERELRSAFDKDDGCASIGNEVGKKKGAITRIRIRLDPLQAIVFSPYRFVAMRLIFRKSSFIRFRLHLSLGQNESQIRNAYSRGPG